MRNILIVLILSLFITENSFALKIKVICKVGELYQGGISTDENKRKFIKKIPNLTFIVNYDDWSYVNIKNKNDKKYFLDKTLDSGDRVLIQYTFSIDHVQLFIWVKEKQFLSIQTGFYSKKENSENLYKITKSKFDTINNKIPNYKPLEYILGGEKYHISNLGTEEQEWQKYTIARDFMLSLDDSIVETSVHRLCVSRYPN